MAARRAESASSVRSALASATGSRGRHQVAGGPVDHGVGQAADRGGDHRDPAGHGLQRHDAERLVPGRGDHHVGRAVPAAGIVRPGHRAGEHAPGRATPPTPPAARSGRALRVGVQRPPGPGRPPTTSSASGSAASARITVGRSPCARPAGRRSGAGAGRSGAPPGRPGGTRSRSTPHGTTDIRPRGTPSRTSSPTSSRQCAMTRSHARPRCAARRPTRPGGLVSAAPWWRRLTEPSAWKVCTTGTSRPRDRRVSAARPDIQKCAWTTSGGHRPRQLPGQPLAKLAACAAAARPWAAARPGRPARAPRRPGRQVAPSAGRSGVVAPGVDA